MCGLYLLGILCVWVLCQSVNCRTLYLELERPTDEELSFMKRYGYLQEVQGEDVDLAYTPHSIAEAVRSLQAFAGVPQTGIIDAETRTLFKKKRCGVKDIETPQARKKRYIIQEGWNKKTISYRVVNGTSTLDKSRVESVMAAGLAVWAPHVGLRFRREDYGEADIMVSFVSGDHGDGFPFDGPGHVVAHAFCPPHGAMHFDDDETWGEINLESDEDVTDLFAVAVHEIGHALGMAHSDVKASVMYPYYQVPVERLHQDDILGMRALYMKDEPQPQPVVSTPRPAPPAERPRPSLQPPAPPAPPVPDEDDLPDLCYANYDAIQVIKGQIYVFEEDWVWVLSERHVVAEGYPKKFRDVFAGLPRHITTINVIYEMRNGNVRIFSGKNYWEFGSDFHLIKRGRIQEYGLPSYVAELTTVFVSNYNNKTYLIEYERFWRYNEDNRTMDRGYPKEMSAWRELPYPVDSALIWDGKTYFFRGPRFWRFDNEMIQAHPYYPQPVAPIWFPCRGSPDMIQYLTNEEP